MEYLSPPPRKLNRVSTSQTSSRSHSVSPLQRPRGFNTVPTEPQRPKLPPVPGHSNNQTTLVSLRRAIVKGDMKLVLRCLESKLLQDDYPCASIDTSPCGLAIKHHQYQILTKLCASKRINQNKKYHYPPLCTTPESKIRGQYAIPALQYAMHIDNLVAVSILAKSGVDLNQTLFWPKPRFTLYSFPINQVGLVGFTPLTYALFHNRLKMAKVLIANGAQDNLDELYPKDKQKWLSRRIQATSVGIKPQRTIRCSV